MTKKIIVMGLPGSGKSTLSYALAPMLKAVHFNADEIRANINRELKFSLEDRIENARRIGWLCNQVVKSGHYAIADFICPTPETRESFDLSNSFVIYMNTIEKGRFEDTNKMFVKPNHQDLQITFTKWYDANEMAKDAFDIISNADDNFKILKAMTF